MPDHSFPPSAHGPPPLAVPLTALVRQRVVPALMDLHAAAGPLPEAFDLARLLAEGGSGDALVQRLVEAGLPFEAIMLRVLAPAARGLGAMWEADTASFAAVTLGLWKLRRVVLRLSDLMPGPVLPPDPQRSILVATIPGEQHDFGIAMLGEFLARDGWHVSRSVPRDTEELIGDLRAVQPAIIGLSVARTAAEPELVALIGAIRHRLGGRPRILIGGPALLAQPGMLRRCGADAAATCARGALEAAAALLGETTQEPRNVQRKDRRDGITDTGRGVPGARSGRNGASRHGRR